jgi:hypothetical protein
MIQWGLEHSNWQLFLFLPTFRIWQAREVGDSGFSLFTYHFFDHYIRKKAKTHIFNNYIQADPTKKAQIVHSLSLEVRYFNTMIFSDHTHLVIIAYKCDIDVIPFKPLAIVQSRWREVALHQNHSLWFMPSKQYYLMRYECNYDDD